MDKAKIHYYDIGDYLSREDKLNIIKDFGSIARIPWAIIEPNEHGDWINHRNEMFKKFVSLGNKEDKKDKRTFFVPYYSRGLATTRDPWCYNSSLGIVKNTAEAQINFYNEQLDKLSRNEISDVNYNTNKISWTAEVLANIRKGKYYKISGCEYRESLYRPFFRQYLLYYKPLNERQYQIPKLFPTPSHKNLVICVSGIGASKDFSTIITDCIPDLQLQFNGQCFPLYWYEESKQTFQSGGMDNMFAGNDNTSQYERHDGVTDWILSATRKQYGYKVIRDCR